MFLQHSFVLLSGYLEDGTPTSASTLLDCTMMCLDTEGCSSFFYSKNSKLCKLAGTRYFSPVGLTSAPEYKYYMMRPDCKTGWRIKFDQCYWYMGVPKNYANAKISCIAIGGYLARTYTLLDDAIIKTLLNEHGYSAWIGGTDEAVEGQWVWDNGQPVNLSLWSPYQPDGNTATNCLEQWSTEWNDGICSYPLSYLCQK